MNPIVLFMGHIKPHYFKWDTLNPILSHIYYKISNKKKKKKKEEVHKNI